MAELSIDTGLQFATIFNLHPFTLYLVTSTSFSFSFRMVAKTQSFNSYNINWRLSNNNYSMDTRHSNNRDNRWDEKGEVGEGLEWGRDTNVLCIVSNRVHTVINECVRWLLQWEKVNNGRIIRVHGKEEQMRWRDYWMKKRRRRNLMENPMESMEMSVISLHVDKRICNWLQSSSSDSPDVVRLQTEQEELLELLADQHTKMSGYRKRLRALGQPVSEDEDDEYSWISLPIIK